MTRQRPNTVSIDVNRGQAGPAVAVILVVLLLIAGIGYLWFYEEVPEGYRGVEWRLGDVTGATYEPGPHVISPLVGVQWVEVRPRTYTMSATVGEGERRAGDAITVKTVNGSSVDVDLTIRYRIRASDSDEFVRDWRNEEQMEQRLIRPTIRSELRDEASNLQTTGQRAIYTAYGREALAVTAREALLREFADEPIVLEAVQVRNIDLPDDIDATLNEKEQAKQRVQVELERVKQERARADQRRVQAQADADVIATRGEAIRDNPEILTLRYIEAIRSTDKVIVGGGEDTPFILDARGDDSPPNDSDTNRRELGNTTTEDIFG